MLDYFCKKSEGQDFSYIEELKLILLKEKLILLNMNQL
jgi:hypothetical protein